MTNILQTGMEWIADRLGESASTSALYRDRIGMDTAITVSLGIETTQIDNTSDITSIVRQKTIVVSDPTIAIDTTGAVVISDVEWAIVSIEVKHANLIVATCERRELYEQGRPNARRR